MSRLLWGVAMFFLGIMTSFAQCCSAGNPVGSNGFEEGLTKNQLRFISYFKQSNSDKYYHKDSYFNQPIINSSSFSFWFLSSSYGITKNLSLNSDIGYFFDKSQELTINSSPLKIASSGFGDFGLSLRYNNIDDENNTQWNLFVGSKLPVGAFEEEIDGVLIPLSLQPSSGAFRYNVGGFYGKYFPRTGFGLSTSLIFESSLWIKKEYIIYKYGNYMQYIVNGSYLWRKFLFISSLKMDYRFKDLRDNDLIVESSGGFALIFSPRIQYQVIPNWELLFQFEQPLYRYVNGFQIVNKMSFFAGVMFNLNLCKKNEE